VLEVEDLAVVLDLLTRPELAPDLDHLVQALAAASEVDAEEVQGSRAGLHL
jgi:hypothetical protein